MFVEELEFHTGSDTCTYTKMQAGMHVMYTANVLVCWLPDD